MSLINIVIVGYNSQISINWNLGSQYFLFFADNSTNTEIKEINREYCEKNNIKYVDMEGNKGIPAAYNRVIALISISTDNFILFLDQDTDIPENFFKNTIQKISDTGADLFFPVVMDSVGVMSPCMIKGKEFKHSQLVDFNSNLNDFSFINSGMCVRSTVFNNICYDDTLFLDFADHDFIKAVREKNCFNFYVNTDIVLNQNFSGAQKNGLSRDFNRFCIFVKDGIKYYKKWYGKASFNDFAKRTIKLSIQYKTLKFLKFLIVELSND